MIPAYVDLLMPTRDRACVRCSHFDDRTDECARGRELQGYNPVTGDEVYSPTPKAATARLPSWDCGPIGKHWAPADIAVYRTGPFVRMPERGI
jgi:hypothetical protein